MIVVLQNDKGRHIVPPSAIFIDVDIVR